MTELTIDEITELALLEFLEHEITEVTFSWNRDKRRAGVTRFRKRSGQLYPVALELSAFAFEASPNKWDMVDTLYHELAHVIAVERYGNAGFGHGLPWKKVAVELGADPVSCKKMNLDPSMYKYTAYCPGENCDLTFGFARAGKLWKRNISGRVGGYYCPDCNLQVKVTQNY